jgi:hypothetical protein
MTEQPDLTLYKLIHKGMRGDTARLAAAVRNLTEADRAARTPAMVRWYAGFFHDFELHHAAEDDIFFPALAERVPVFADRLDRLDAEHHVLLSALTTVREALGALVDPEVDWRSVRDDAVHAIADADNEITMHLDHEDADVLPLFVQHMSKIEYNEIGERALKAASPKSLLFSVPWVMSQAEGEERTRIFRDAELPMKIIWYATRGRYARLAERALGPGVTIPTRVAA